MKQKKKKGEGSPLPPKTHPGEERGTKEGAQPPQNEAWTPPKSDLDPKEREGVPKTVAFESGTSQKQRGGRGLNKGAGLGPGRNPGGGAWSGSCFVGVAWSQGRGL